MISFRVALIGLGLFVLLVYLRGANTSRYEFTSLIVGLSSIAHVFVLTIPIRLLARFFKASVRWRALGHYAFWMGCLALFLLSMVTQTNFSRLLIGANGAVLFFAIHLYAAYRLDEIKPPPHAVGKGTKGEGSEKKGAALSTFS